MTTTRPLQRTPRSGNPIGYTDSYAITVVGTADQLTNLITNHRTAGTLIAVGRPFPLRHRPGHYQLRIRLRNQVPARPTAQVTSVAAHTHTRIRGPRRRTRIAVIAVAITGTVAGTVAVAAYLLGQLVELITAHLNLVLGGAAATLLLLAALFRAGVCPGIHCLGCRHH